MEEEGRRLGITVNVLEFHDYIWEFYLDETRTVFFVTYERI